jgi:hypothetical protein
MVRDIVKNTENPPRYYTSHTSDVVKRQGEHNAGACVHTAKYRPWTLSLMRAACGLVSSTTGGA